MTHGRSSGTGPGAAVGGGARRTGRAVRVLLALVVGIAGCDLDDLVTPIPPKDVTITLSVSGGFAGVSYRIVVDGADREARIDCDAFCDMVDELVPLSSAQITALADALDAAGVIEENGRDFGTECCDQFHFDLTYERGSRTGRVRGSQERLPSDIRDVATLLMGLATGRVPILVAQDSHAEDWIDDLLSLTGASVAGRAVVAEVRYSGGCAPHRIDLVAWGGWMESFPVQIEAILSHDDGDDPCDAIVTEERSFDVGPLVRAYEEAYGPRGSEPIRIRLRLSAPDASTARILEITY